MSAHDPLMRLGTALYLLAIGTFAGVALELLITGHYEAPLQAVPLIGCAAGIALLALDLLTPGLALARTNKALLIVIGLSGVVGVLVHVSGNLEFAREVNAAKANAAPLAALFGGGNPPLAPGAMCVGAAIGWLGVATRAR
jgi:hypothetical protein